MLSSHLFQVVGRSDAAKRALVLGPTTPLGVLSSFGSDVHPCFTCEIWTCLPELSESGEPILTIVLNDPPG